MIEDYRAQTQAFDCIFHHHLSLNHQAEVNPYAQSLPSLNLNTSYKAPLICQSFQIHFPQTCSISDPFLSHVICHQILKQSKRWSVLPIHPRTSRFEPSYSWESIPSHKWPEIGGEMFDHAYWVVNLVISIIDLDVSS